MLGENVQWVSNIRAAGGRAFIRGGSRKTIQCEEVAVDQLAPILRAYLQHVPGARPHVPVNKDAPVADFERIASDYPIFRVVFLASD
jgi:hypothetical protein